MTHFVSLTSLDPTRQVCTGPEPNSPKCQIRVNPVMINIHFKFSFLLQYFEMSFLCGQVMGYERPMFFKAAKPQSLDLGLIGLDAQEEAASSQVGTVLYQFMMRLTTHDDKSGVLYLSLFSVPDPNLGPGP